MLLNSRKRLWITAGCMLVALVLLSHVNFIGTAISQGIQTVKILSGNLTADTELPTATTMGDGVSNPTLPSLAAYLVCFNGTTWDRCKGALEETDDGSIASGQSAGAVITLPQVYNGTTWGRLLSAANGLNSTGSGIAAAQLVGQFDDTTPTAITENQFGNLRISANRNLFSTIRDAAGNERGANVNASNELLVALSSLPTLAAGTNNIGDVDVLTLPALPAGTNNIGDVDVLSLPALPAGTNNIGDVDVLTLPALPTGTNSIGTVQPGNTQNTTPWLTETRPGTSGGTAISRTVAAASTNATNVKASAGQVYQIIASNVSASARFVHLYNTAGTPTCNASIIATFIVPGQTTGAGTNIVLAPGAAFGTGIGFCITTANDGTGSVSAGDVVLNVVYK